ncbi:MAG TPA: carboxypeptidase-like regulatory domain-containing protein, partial [Cyclobacteriaceae bacterium]|nr:carboxypeptidase-like regulatory domain-containing protein [Cyclobacteriaceae bacterium]
MRFLLLFIFLGPLILEAQAQRLSGKVVAAVNKEGLPGVNVVLKGTAKGAVTDIEGAFTVDVTLGTTVVFSFVGYKTQELVYDGQSNITIELEEAANELSEIVVVGYTSISKKDITGAISTVNADDLKNLSVNGLDQALQGQVAGVQVTQSSGTPGGGVSVRIRGATSI